MNSLKCRECGKPLDAATMKKLADLAEFTGNTIEAQNKASPWKCSLCREAEEKNAPRESNEY